jgi:hypothetical protein
LKNLLPEPILNFLLAARTRFYERKLSKSGSASNLNQGDAVAEA